MLNPQSIIVFTSKTPAQYSKKRSTEVNRDYKGMTYVLNVYLCNIVLKIS